MSSNNNDLRIVFVDSSRQVSRKKLIEEIQALKSENSSLNSKISSLEAEISSLRQSHDS
ncbi:12821_t:CDS:2 [Dentiscutata erythropus]|uniref:12821_t:CDS:1 n=1 Tax=Dentiscutata erythropus TaxID=1348616 RepID=A0A9N8ZE20_9GLOM|nr:12821_t:CDS:2 [Dentiscutata erythropus]